MTDSHNGPVIEVESLTKWYGNKRAIEGVDLSVRAGKIFGFLGPNGAGKSTVVKILTGLVAPTSGRVEVLGSRPGDVRAKQRIGFLPEHFRFPDWLSATELLRFHGRLYGIKRGDLSSSIGEILELVELRDNAGQRIRAFSKGMQQRLGIAQALIGRPDLVFLDEPTSALDPLGRREVRQILLRLKDSGVTVFLNSHLLSEVELVCDEVAIIDRGRIIRQGTLTELLERRLILKFEVDRMPKSVILDFEGRFGVVSKDGNSGYRVNLKKKADVPEVASFLLKCGLRLYGLQTEHLTLEDLFCETVEGGEGK